MNSDDPKPFREKTFQSGLTLNICKGDITRMDCDVIVNAANEHLVHGGGVAAAIARSGGEAVQRESRAWVRTHGPISHDRPAFTTGGNLPCKYIVHAVGPRWGEGDEENKLAQTIRSSLQLANDLNARSISFPAISTGIFGFPVDQAAQVILETILTVSRNSPSLSINQINLVLFDQKTLNIFVNCFDSLFKDWRKK